MPQTEIDWTVTVECWFCDTPTHVDDALPMVCQGYPSMCEGCAEQHYQTCAECQGE
jgi:hypothetical protein